jgi:hypothetical protein
MYLKSSDKSFAIAKLLPHQYEMMENRPTVLHTLGEDLIFLTSRVKALIPAHFLLNSNMLMYTVTHPSTNL